MLRVGRRGEGGGGRGEGEYNRGIIGEEIIVGRFVEIEEGLRSELS